MGPGKELKPTITSDHQRQSCHKERQLFIVYCHQISFKFLLEFCTCKLNKNGSAYIPHFLLLMLGMRTALAVLALLCGGARGQSKVEAAAAAMADVGNQMAKLQKLMMGEIKKIEQPSPKCDIYTQINDVSRTNLSFRL